MITRPLSLDNRIRVGVNVNNNGTYCLLKIEDQDSQVRVGLNIDEIIWLVSELEKIKRQIWKLRNERRCELIHKRIKTSLTEIEQQELDLLQLEADKITEPIARKQLEHLAKIEKLLGIGENDGTTTVHDS